MGKVSSSVFSKIFPPRTQLLARGGSASRSTEQGMPVLVSKQVKQRGVCALIT